MPLGKKTSNTPPKYIDVSGSKASRTHEHPVRGYWAKITHPFRRQEHKRARRRTKAEIMQLGTRKSEPSWWSDQARKRRKEAKLRKKLLREYGGS